MAAQHTPGPWALGEGGYEDHVFGPDGYEVMGAPTYASIHRDFYARRMGDGHWGTTDGAFIERGDEVPRANARLAAAAPDLLTVVRHYVLMGPGRCTVGHQLVDMALAAIAKAEGR